MARKNGILYGQAYNDVDYFVKRTENKKTVWTCPFYKSWHPMMTRCFSDKYKQKFPTYSNVTCSEDFKYFSKYKAWAEHENWKGMVLDKDLLVIGNKFYSADTCVFIPPELNSFLTFCNAKRGDYPLGVSLRQEERAKYTKPYVACISVQGNGNKTLGYRDNPIDSHMLWLEAKIEGFNLFKGISEKIDIGIENWQKHLEYHLNNRIIFEL